MSQQTNRVRVGVGVFFDPEGLSPGFDLVLPGITIQIDEPMSYAIIDSLQTAIAKAKEHPSYRPTELGDQFKTITYQDGGVAIFRSPEGCEAIAVELAAIAQDLKVGMLTPTQARDRLKPLVRQLKR